MNRITICLTANRSFGRLAKAVEDMNKNLYASDIWADDRVELKPVYDSEYNLMHFEVTGSPLDMFQIGLRYGHMEEKEYLKPYVMPVYQEVLYKSLEASPV